MTQKSNTKTQDFIPSQYQENIFNHILNDNRNLIISAVAGSGKTTTLLKVLEMIPEDKSVLFMAFNVTIADELKLRVPKDKYNITVNTVHSFGRSSLSTVMTPSLDVRKYRGILNSIIEYKTGKNLNSIREYGFNEEQQKYVNEIFKLIPTSNVLNELKDFPKNITELCNLGRLNLVNFDIKSIGVSEMNKIATKFSIENNNNESTIGWFLLKIGTTYHKSIDYTDMVSLPIILDLDVEKYDFVFVDESQDLNACQRELMLKSIKDNVGRFIAVGDEKQAIYAFAGSDYESYQKLKGIPNTLELPLSYTYRCAPEIVNMVKHINPLITPHPKNKKGKVFETFSYKNVEDGDMVLCRNSFPVVSLCIKLLTEGKKSYVIGSDIGESISKLIKSTEKLVREYTIDNVIQQLLLEKEKMVEKSVTKNKITRSEALEESHIVIFNEKIQMIEALSDGINDPNVVIEKIKSIFSDDKKTGIKLSTIHKSKGLEAERVFIIHQELIPSKHAIQPWQIEQEKNLEYVAYTRAKTVLGFINDFDAFKTHKKREIDFSKIKVSKHIRPLNSKLKFTLTVTGKRIVNSKFGNKNEKVVVYDLIDDDGNIFTKWKEIDSSYIVGNIKGRSVEVNTRVSFFGKVMEHKEFNGNKVNKLGDISFF
jgi:DNA helicase-2/ATP-dependent DNA helicase PcrA